VIQAPQGNPRAVLALSLPNQSQPLAEQTLYLCFIGLWILVTDALASQIARKFVQFERERQALLAGHPLVSPDLLL
jgi:hypothetical protein